jgi:hypothetical protein
MFFMYFVFTVLGIWREGKDFGPSVSKYSQNLVCS